MHKAEGYVRLMRPLNCAMMGFAVLVGAVLVDPDLVVAHWLWIAYGFVTGFTLCAAAMTINDYYDRAIDAINEPRRPIPSGTIRPNEAIAFVAILSAVGFAFALLVSPLCLAVALASMAIVATYLTVGKRTGLPGNFLVSACVAIPFIYGSVTVVGTVGLNVVFFALMAFLSNTGREITKGIVDIAGDRAGNVRTLAVRFGEKTAAAAAAAFYLAAVALTSIPYLMGLVSVWFIPLVLATDIGLVACSAILLLDHSREKARKVKNAVLLLFIVGLLAYVVGVFK
ncbi:MAG: geranylgeranylglycerol-phosphate geranylgeranyltransferase [Candidatus Bathyarchaeia archaeon]